MTDKQVNLYELVSTSGSTRATITDFGATLTSFRVAKKKSSASPTGGSSNSNAAESESESDEVLFVRPDAKLDGSKPISGGVPHCWPQFGPGVIVQHGFARKCSFDVLHVTSSSISLRLTHNATSKAEWDEKVNRSNAFHYDYHVEVMDQGKLVMTSEVKNISTTEEMDFTAALHTYYKLPGIDQVKVYGMEGLEFLDKVQDKFNPPPVQDDQTCIQVAGTASCHEEIHTYIHTYIQRCMYTLRVFLSITSVHGLFMLQKIGIALSRIMNCTDALR